jgi:uncharacterized protein (DUF58 family)
MAQRLVDGYLAGHHRSPRPGEGAELLQFRAYEPGDDLRRVDWRAYARSDRFFVRESEVERDIVVRFVLDATSSMSVADAGSEGSKLDAARSVVATLAMLADRQGDRVHLHVVGEGAGSGTPRGGGRGLSGLFSQLESVEAVGQWGDRGLARAGFPSRRRRDLVILVGDLFQHGQEIEEDLGRLAAVGHDLIVVQLLHRSEHDFVVPPEAVFREVESGRRMAVATAGLRAEYLARRDSELEHWRRLCGRRGHTYRLVLTDQGLSEWLPLLLRSRRASAH